MIFYLLCLKLNQKEMLMILIFCLLTALCLYLVNYYASKEVSLHVKFWSVITWVLTFGLALLVPEDVYLTLNQEINSTQGHLLGQYYVILYWLVYLLTWTIIPVLQEWEDAGDIQSKDRLKRSLKINGIFYLVLLVIAIVALLVIFFLGIGKDMGLIIFLKCLATMWGMLLLMILLGYSLVEIPKTLWFNADHNNYLGYLYQKINEIEDEVEESKKQFKLIAAYIGYVKKNTKDESILGYCQVSQQKIPSNLRAIVKSNFQKVITTTGYLQTYPICLQNSIQHNRMIKRAIARCRRNEHLLNFYITEAVFYEDVKKAVNSGENLQSLVKKTNYLQSWWYCNARPKANKIFAALIGICSLIILLSQSQVFFTQKYSILRYLLLFDNFQVIRLLVFFIIAFIVYMSNYALFRLKLANLYGLYYKESDGASLMFATVNFSRIGVAIVLNFFDMIKFQSIYGQVMQTPEMGLLGEWVLKGLPGVLWLIVICHLFNVWGWIAQKVGFYDSYSFSSHELKDLDLISSPVLVIQKRKELQDNKMQNPEFEMIQSF